MSNPSDSQEFHENTREFFPEFDSVRSYRVGVVSKKKGLVAKMIASGSTAVTVALVLIPYIICKFLFIGDTAVTISTRAVNVDENVRAYYLIADYPQQTDAEILNLLQHNPELGTPLPLNGELHLNGLNPHTPYKLIFYTIDDTQGDGKPEIIGKRSFQTDPEPFVPPREEGPDPTVPTVPETRPPEPAVPAPHETTAPIEETTAPTEETTVPTEPPVVPTQPPIPPAPEPQPEPPAPTPPPAPPVASVGTPSPSFTERSDGQHVFSVDFPFNLKNATPSRGEFVYTHIHSDGSTTTDAPVAAAVTATGTGAVLKLTDAAVPLGEGLRVEPVLYYQDGAGVETRLPGTAYEASPGGADSSAGVSFRFSNSGYQLEYDLTVDNIKNSASGQPAGSSLTVESLEFIFYNKGAQVGTPQILSLGETISGTSYSKAGTMSIPGDPYFDAQDVQVNVHTAWKIGGQSAVVSSTGARAGIPAASVTSEPVNVSAVPLYGTGDTELTFDMPFTLNGGTAQSIHIAAKDGAGNEVAASDGISPVNPHMPGYFSHSITCRLSPGETVNVEATLTYDDGGTVKTAFNSKSITAGTLANASGTFNFRTHKGKLYADVNIRDMVNPYLGDDSGMEVTEFQFIFTPYGGGTSKTITGHGVFFPGGNENPSCPVDISSANYALSGDYTVEAILTGRWHIGGNYVQDVQTQSLPGKFAKDGVVTFPYY